MERQSVVIIEVEDFIRRWDAKELVFTPEAKTLTSEFYDGKNFWRRPKKHYVNFPNEIGQAIAEYKWYKDFQNPALAFKTAFQILAMVQKAYAFGVIKETTQQTRDFEHEILQLKEELEQCKEQGDRLRNLNGKLTFENKRLHNLVPDAQRGKKEIGGTDKL